MHHSTLRIIQPHASCNTTTQETYTCLSLDLAYPASQVIAGRASGGLVTLSMHTGRAIPTAQSSSFTDVVTVLAAGGPRGPLLGGTSTGQVLVCDPRQSYTVQQRLVAHPCMFIGVQYVWCTVDGVVWVHC